MHKSFSLFLSLLFVFGLFILQDCSRLEQSSLNNERQKGLPWHYVSIEKAEKELEGFLAEIYPTLKSSPKRVVSERYTLKTASTKADGDPIIMHVFNFDDNLGYAIMPGDKRVPSPMCFVEAGHYEEDNQDTDLDEFIMSELIGMYQAARILPDSIKYEVSPLAEDFPLMTKADGFVPVDTVFNDNKYYVYYNWAQNGSPNGTILTTRWNQDEPFNESCPTQFDSSCMDYRHCLVGCVPVAVGQIMAYWKLNPPSGNPYYGLNWNYISPIEDSLSTPNNYTGWAMLKTLLVRLGDSVNLDANYGLNATSAYSSYAPRTFSRFGYTHKGTQKTYNADSVRLYLNTGPVLGSGYDKRSQNWLGIYEYDGGHAWVFDQCYNRKRPVMVYDSNWNIITGQWQVDHVLHINWGWGGSFNGYYANSRFNIWECMSDPPLMTKTTNSPEGIDYYFQYDLKMITGIRP
ncbi:MAG: C10 family peptidase [Bacteroidales bacterium]|nr:C10 family peptidase [Bacteroidales bacterium]